MQTQVDKMLIREKNRALVGGNITKECEEKVFALCKNMIY